MQQIERRERWPNVNFGPTLAEQMEEMFDNSDEDFETQVDHLEEVYQDAYSYEEYLMVACIRTLRSRMQGEEIAEQ